MKRKLKLETVEDYIGIVATLEYPCAITISHNDFERSGYRRNDRRSHAFEQWLGAWAHQSDQYLLHSDRYAPLGMLENFNEYKVPLVNGKPDFEIEIHEFTREEYIAFVTKRHGAHFEPGTLYKPPVNRDATPEEIGRSYDQTKFLHAKWIEEGKEAPYYEWWKENWRKYDPDEKES